MSVWVAYIGIPACLVGIAFLFLLLKRLNAEEKQLNREIEESQRKYDEIMQQNENSEDDEP